MNYPRVDSNRWEEMKSLFDAALLQDEKDWAKFLASRCGEDKQFAAEIHELLLADREASQYLAAPLIRVHNLFEGAPGNASLELHQILCGRFEIVAYLGEGGMGLVYEALDLEMNQHIAIKTIRTEFAEIPGALARFKREVYTTLKVTHPNVCRTFDLESHKIHGGEGKGPDVKITFLTMELLKGETLAQRLRRTGALPPELVRELASQVANALLAAHNAGIVHCDLKPSNIFLTGSDSSLRAVVTDFGIARIIQSQDQISASLPWPLENRTGLAGTPAYMAPEQSNEGRCTPGSDIYSFGLVLFEALTGERLSLISPSPEELRSRLGEAVDEQSQSGIAWSVLLSECLQAEHGKRLNHVQALLDYLQRNANPSPRGAIASREVLDGRLHRLMLRWLAQSKATRSISVGAAIVSLSLTVVFVQKHHASVSNQDTESISSVVVLPFVNKSEDPSLNWLGDSLAAKLSNELAQFSGVRVPSQATVSGLGKHPDLKSIGRQLGVDAVVDGSVMKAADGYLVQVALVDAQTGAQRWGESYTSNPKNLPALQEDISQEITFRLVLAKGISGGRPNRHEQATAAAAQAAFLKGKDALAENTPASVEKAASDFQLAIDSDPQYAPAFAQLAKCYLAMGNYYNRPETAKDLRSKAESAARRALQLDTTSADAYTGLAKVQVFRNFDWSAAEKNFGRAVQLDPGNISAHLNYGFFLLTARGRFAEARAQYAYGDRVIPRPVGIDVHEAISEYFARQYGDSVKRAEALRNSQPDNEVVVEILSEDYLALNQPTKAIALLSKFKAKSEDARISKEVMLGIAFAKLGQKSKAQDVLRRIEKSKEPNFDLPFHLAALAAALGDKTRAFEYLEQSYNLRQTSILFLGVDALMDSLRTDPRFNEMMVKLNLNSQNEKETIG